MTCWSEWPRYPVLMATSTAPASDIPSQVQIESGALSAMITTDSPRVTPVASRPFATEHARE